MNSPSQPHTDPVAVRPAPDAESVRRGHEVRDVNIPAVLWLGAGVTAAILVSGGVIWALLIVLQADAARNDPTLSPLAQQAEPPPLPHLQSSPRRDFVAFKTEQAAQLNTYGWVNRKQKKVRIPVSRAMDLVLEKGVPSPGAPRTEAAPE